VQVADANARADAAKAEPPTSADEIKRLKDELAKANAELDRIRKRLAQPPRKPDQAPDPGRPTPEKSE
jgi:molecular chaperone GrpE (heat shock protein)